MRLYQWESGTPMAEYHPADDDDADALETEPGLGMWALVPPEGAERRGTMRSYLAPLLSQAARRQKRAIRMGSWRRTFRREVRNTVPPALKLRQPTPCSAPVGAKSTVKGPKGALSCPSRWQGQRSQ